MKIIFIGGPSGSGKTTLSNQIIAKIKNGIILSTDNYYKTGFISKLLSKVVDGYFDKRLSFNYKLFKKDFNYILNSGTLINKRSYDFERKKINSFLNKANNINLMIIEGIFAKEISRTLCNQNHYFLELKINKNECMKRVVKRDIKERGKLKKQAEEDFLKSWDIYYQKLKNKNIKNNANDFIITKNSNIDKILKNYLNKF
tara:strand:+ start:305 stop:907 length:603 start_codon:yes stop_codon:yes gene_type:complete